MAAYFGSLQKFVSSLPMPWWLRRRNVMSFLEAVGATYDNGAEDLAQGMRFMHPLRCDASALPILARDRSMRLYPTEGVASQRERLANWKPLHRQRGTHQGELRNVAPYFNAYPCIPTMRIVHQSGSGARATWHTLGGSDDGYGINKPALGTFVMSAIEPSNFNWDNQPTKRSRFWLIMYTSGLGFTAADEWDGGETWGGGAIWDSIFTAAQIADIAAMVRDKKAAHSRLAGVVFAGDPTSFDPAAPIVVNGDGTSTMPNGKWGATIDPVTGLPTRNATARYVIL